MAVDIPVVIDIDKAFAEAAAKVPKAMAPLESSINKLNDRLAKANDNLNKYKIGSKNWEKAAKEVQLVAQAIETANEQFDHFASNGGSIKQMSNDLAALRRRWEEMGAKQKFDSKGNLSAEAQQLISDYKRISAELEKSGKTLAQMEQEEKRLAEAAQRRAELTKKGAQARQYENAILNTNVKTMRILQEQERILSDRLSRAVIGSSKYNQLRTQLEGVRKEMEKAKGSADTLATSLNRQSGVVGRLAGQFASYISIYSLLRFAKQIRDVTGELEYQRVALGHLIQDEEYGAELFERIKAAAIESPFRIKDLVTYTKQLAAYKVEQEELFGTMMRLADVSAGLGVDMNRLILAYGQVRAASVLRGQELRQFTEAGIPLVDMLAEKFTELNGRVVKTSEVFELISKRAVPFSMISEIFEDLTEKGGMFYEMQERQAATLTGRWEKLKDAFDIGLQSVGNTKTFQVYNDVILGALNLVAKNLQLLPKLIEGASAAWILYYAATTRARIATRRAAMAEIEEATAKEAQSIANIRGIKNVDAYTYALLRQKTATNALTRGFWKLWAAVVASPVGAAVAAIGAIAAALFLFRKRTDEAQNSFHEFDELIEDTSKGLKDTARYDKLIDRYERLAQKTDLTDKEHQRLYQTMSLLQEQFPGVTVGIDNETEAIDEQLRKLRELNDEREREVRERGEGELGAKRVELTDAEKKRDKMYRDRLRQQQEAARLERELAINDLYKDSKEWQNAQKRIGEINRELSEQDKLIEGLQKRIVSLNRILHPEEADPFTGWKKQIQEMRDLTVGEVTSPIFTDDEIEKWGTLDEALADIAKRKKVVKEREDSLSVSIKNQTGEIRDQIQAELDWAQAERVRLESMEAFFSSYSSYAQSLIDDFAGLLLRSYDEGTFKRIGEEMTQMFPKSNADLLARPMIDAAKLVEKGWKDAGDGIATVYSSVYDWEDEKGVKHNIMVTPILPDGSVLSPEELDAYVKKITEDANHVDDKRLVIGVDVDEDAGEKLHQMQDDYYRLKQLQEEMRGKKPEEYLISDKELMNVQDVMDMIDLIDKKISSIEKEIQAQEKIKLGSNISDEAKQDAEDYLRNLQSIYDMLVLLKGQYEDELSDLAKEVQGLFPNLMESAFKGVDKGTFSNIGLFSDKDLKGVKTVVDLYGLWSSKIKSVTKEIENYSKKMSESISEEQRQKILDTIQSLSDEKGLLEEMGKVFGFLLKESGGGSGYQQDPWILIFKNRAKFMQDFRAGVEDLNKYMSESMSLGKIQDAMKGRGASLGIDVSELNGSRQEMLAWYDKTIQEITEKIQKLGGKTWAGLGVQAILAKDTKSRTLKAWQDLLADIFKERTDFDLSQQKKDLEDAFKRMKDELKQSETVKKFYDDLLSMTGDSDLATTITVSVYGGIGQDFKERMQSQLNEAFASLGDDAKTPEMKAAIDSQDFGYILDNLSQFPKEWQDVLKDMAKDSQKHYADMMMDIAKAYEKAKDYDERRTDVHNREAQRRVEIEEWYKRELERIRKEEEAGQITHEEAETQSGKAAKVKDTYTAASNQKEAKETAAIDVEELKNTYEWTKAFEDLDRVGNKTLSDLAVKIQEIIDKEGNLLTPEQLKAMSEALEKVKNTEASRNPITAVSEGFTGARLAKQGMSAIASGNPTAIANAKKAIDEFNKSAKGTVKLDFDHLEDGFRDANKQMEKGIEGMADYVSAWGQLASGLQTVRDYMGEVFDIEDIPIVDEVLKGVTDSLSFISAILPVIITLNGILNGTLMMNPFIAMAAGIIATIGAVVGLIKGIINAKVERLNKKIEEQEDILHNLEKDYDALDKAIQKAFGSDYISTYNQQLKIMEAQIAAYREQARLEREKGKKADEDTAKGYEEEAEKLEQKMAEMRSQVSEFMADSDVTSAAKSFAESWIDAYKQFAFTSGAIKENFKEMIDSMVVNSLAAKIIQGILQPIFDDIDRLAQDGEELSEQDIAKIAAETEVATEKIDTAMQALMQRLAAAGINMRATGSDLSGISKDIAGASEESINGLAAGINTQNFYMSYMPAISATVDAILAAIGGSTSENTAAGRAMARATSADNQTGQTFGDETFRGQMQRIDENISEMRYMLKSVITPKSANTNTHAVATK